MATDETGALREEIRRLRGEVSRAAPDLRAMLRLRGFKVFTMEPSDDLLIPGPDRVEEFYETMKKYSFRLFLRDVIKHRDGFTKRDVTHYASAEVTGEYIDYMLEAGLVARDAGGYRLRRRIESFGGTLEWFMAEVFRREFLTEAIWGVKFKGQRTGGDYDLIARVDGAMLYMEVKSSPPKQIYDSGITAFMDRVGDLHAAISVFFMDTELRMKDKIVPMFEEELGRRSSPPPEVVRMEKELFRIGDKIFIINSKDSVAGNIEKILARYFRGMD